MADTKKCARPACGCTAAEGKKYCGQVCEDSKSFTELSCHCGHPGCTAQPAR